MPDQNRPNRRNNNPPEFISAPYNFVPLSSWVYEPDWAGRVSQDFPFKDGINGTLEIEIKAHTPILVGGKHTKPVKPENRSNDVGSAGEVKFFRISPSGRHAIPGSSLKGMIRNVLTIASFGKMSQADDRWYSIRDLSSGVKHIYGSKMTDDDWQPRSKTGYLQPPDKNTPDTWKLLPCEYARVEHNKLIAWGEHLDVINPANIKLEQNAQSKYELWDKTLEVSFDLPSKHPNWRQNRRNRRNGVTHVTPDHMKAQNLGSGTEEGRLVFTGQPQDNLDQGGEKYQEFVFYFPKNTKRQYKPIEIPSEVMRSFIHVHQETNEWKYWKERLHMGLGVPVFYLEDESYRCKNPVKTIPPSAIGLAQMFRLPYSRTIGQTISYTHDIHRSEKQHDLAELLFGTINQDDQGKKGRISFSTAKLEGNPEYYPMEPPVVLNSPKPTFYPAYIRQIHGPDGKLSKATYKTLMDWDCEIRGWKRYPVKEWIGGTTSGGSRDPRKRPPEWVKTKLHPLKAGSIFKGRIQIHNLRPVELGALLWALTWGQDDERYHNIGMGKPFGLGRIQIKIISPEKTRRANTGSDPELANLKQNNGQEPLRVKDLINQFIQEMNRKYVKAVNLHTGITTSWWESEQIVQLLAMADPKNEPAPPEKGHYMVLEDFRESKNAKLVLRPHVDFKGPSDHTLFPQRNAGWAKLEQEKRETEEAEAARKKAEAEQREREQARNKLPPIQKKVLNELDCADNPNAVANQWVTQLATAGTDDARLIAKVLRDFYKEKGMWSGKQSRHQKEKVRTIKQYLPQA